MATDKILAEIAERMSDFATAVTPAALGAAVSQVFAKGLTWTERAMAIVVGIVVSYYATRLLVEGFGVPPFATQAVSFTTGLVAYQAVPKLRDAAIAALLEVIAVTQAQVAGVIAAAAGRIDAWIAARKEPRQ